MIADLVTLLRAQEFENVGSRVYPNNIPQRVKERPVIRCVRLGTDHYNTLGETSGLEAADVDIDCMSESAAEAAAVAVLVKDFIKDYSGPMGMKNCKAVILQDETDGTEPAKDGSDTPTEMVTLNCLVQYA